MAQLTDPHFAQMVVAQMFDIADDFTADFAPLVDSAPLSLRYNLGAYCIFCLEQSTEGLLNDDDSFDFDERLPMLAAAHSRLPEQYYRSRLDGWFDALTSAMSERDDHAFSLVRYLQAYCRVHVVDAPFDLVQPDVADLERIFSKVGGTPAFRQRIDNIRAMPAVFTYPMGNVEDVAELHAMLCRLSASIRTVVRRLHGL